MHNTRRYADSPSWYGLPPAKDEYLYEYARKRRRPQAAPQHAHQLQAPGDPSGGGGGGPLMLLSMGLTVPSVRRPGRWARGRGSGVFRAALWSVAAEEM